jgi:hypothetical protein
VAPGYSDCFVESGGSGRPKWKSRAIPFEWQAGVSPGVSSALSFSLSEFRPRLVSESNADD